VVLGRSAGTGPLAAGVVPTGAEALHQNIMMQSSITAYSDTFLFMFYASLPVLLIILTLKKTDLLPAPKGESQHVEAVE